jgi:hypothetical protein
VGSFSTQKLDTRLVAPAPPSASGAPTSATSTVPRTPATAFGVRTSIVSPAVIFWRAAASPILPVSSSITERPGTSVIVSTDRSRIVTSALPPSRKRAIDCSPVVMRSRRNTSSLNLSATGSGLADRTAVTVPSRVVTTPARVGWPNASDGLSADSSSSAIAAM